MSKWDFKTRSPFKTKRQGQKQPSTLINNQDMVYNRNESLKDIDEKIMIMFTYFMGDKNQYWMVLT